MLRTGTVEPAFGGGAVIRARATWMAAARRAGGGERKGGNEGLDGPWRQRGTRRPVGVGLCIGAAGKAFLRRGVGHPQCSARAVKCIHYLLHADRVAKFKDEDVSRCSGKLDMRMDYLCEHRASPLRSAFHPENGPSSGLADRSPVKNEEGPGDILPRTGHGLLSVRPGPPRYNWLLTPFLSPQGANIPRRQKSTHAASLPSRGRMPTVDVELFNLLLLAICYTLCGHEWLMCSSQKDSQPKHISLSLRRHVPLDSTPE